MYFISEYLIACSLKLSMAFDFRFCFEVWESVLIIFKENCFSGETSDDEFSD